MAQVVKLLRPTMIFNPGIFPSYGLNQVDALQAQILETGVYVLLNVIGREAVIESKLAAAGPLEILGGILVAT